MKAEKQQSNNYNDNNNNLYFTRVTQSNTGFDFRCGPPILRIILVMLWATELKIVPLGKVS